MTASNTFATRVEVMADSAALIIEGELDIAAEAAVLAEMARALEGPAARLVVDVTAVGFIDSSGLRALLGCRDLAQRQGRAFSLRVGANPVVRRLLELAGVDGWFSFA